MAVDENLWLQCKRVCPRVKPVRLPYFCGTVSHKGQQRWLYIVDGNKIKIMERKGGKNKKGNPDFMDFVEGGNGQEDPELCKPDECLLDVRNDIFNWPFVAYHEIAESVWMQEGQTYEEAHEKANKGEAELRKRAYGPPAQTSR